MAEKPRAVKDLLTMYKAFFVELPVAGSKASLGIAKDGEVEGAVWKGYEAWVRLLNHSTNMTYLNPFVGDYVARSLHQALRWQRLTSSVAGAFFTGLWSAVGLPAAAEVQGMRAELQALRREVRDLIAEAQPERAKEELEGKEEEVMRGLEERISAWREQAAA